jgi:hypothetical protein
MSGSSLGDRRATVQGLADRPLERAHRIAGRRNVNVPERVAHRGGLFRVPLVSQIATNGFGMRVKLEQLVLAGEDLGD